MKISTSAAYRRHDISELAWERIKPLLPGQKGSWGGVANDNRMFINAVFWVLRTGSPWRDLSPDYGDWKNTHRRFCRWRDKGVWSSILEALTEDPDMQWLIIDATHIKVHAHGTGAVGGNDKMGLTKGGSIVNCTLPLTYMVPLRAVLTAGPVADCQVAPALIEGLTIDSLLADRGYDSDSLIMKAQAQGMEPVIPARRNRKEQREYDTARYKKRHIVENVFAHLKQWPGIATRYAKRASSFLASIQIRFVAIWAQIS